MGVSGAIAKRNKKLHVVRETRMLWKLYSISICLSKAFKRWSVNGK